MDPSAPERPFRLLNLPKELRDIVYHNVLFASAWTDDISQRQNNLNRGVQIHTNILLTSRQVFEEAQNVINGAQLVQVNIRGAIPSRLKVAAVVEDGVPMFHGRYRNFCLLKHNIDQYFPLPFDENNDTSCILRKVDVFRFCGGIPGLDPDCYVPKMLSHEISHTLKLRNPEARLAPAPANVSISVPSHRRLLEEYHRALSGGKNIWITVHWSVELDDEMACFVSEMTEKIMSSNPSRICSPNGRWRNGGGHNNVQKTSSGGYFMTDLFVV